jgi:transposase
MTYQSDLSEEQFEYIKQYLPKKKKTSTRKHTYLELFNAMLYVLVSGCQWRMLPNDLPKWKTVYHYFNTWSKLEVFDEMLKKTLKSSDYKSAERNIQAYYSQTPKAPRTLTLQEKKTQDLMEERKSKALRKVFQLMS